MGRVVVRYDPVSDGWAPPAGGASPFFSDDFESYSVGAIVSGGDGSFAWSASVPDGGPFVSDDIAHSGTRCLRGEYNPSRAEQRFNLGRTVSEIWVEYYLYFPDGTEGFGSAAWERTVVSPTKMMTMWSPDGDGYNFAFCTFEYWGQQDGVDHSRILFNKCNGSGGVSDRPGGYISLPAENALGQWIQFRTHWKWSSGSGVADGISQTWIDGVLAEDLQNLVIWESGAGTTSTFRLGYLMGSANQAFPSTTYVYLDDIKFYDSDPGW